MMWWQLFLIHPSISGSSDTEGVDEVRVSRRSDEDNDEMSAKYDTKPGTRWQVILHSPCIMSIQLSSEVCT